MIHPAFGLVTVAALAVALARKRPAVRPVAALLVALSAIAIARATGLPPRPSAALWISWACVQGAYTWWAWKDEGPRANPEPCACLSRSETASPRGVWTPATPASPSCITLSLARLALPALPFLPVRWTPLAWHALLVAPHVAAVAVGIVAWAGARPRTVAQAVALVLTWSAALDVAIGALAPGAGWVRAAPLAWATWGVVGAALVATARKA